MIKVQVLLSAYNSTDFFKEQLDSVLNQKNVDVELLIRDDGSNNEITDKIIDYYISQYSNIHYYHGENCGPAYSFIDLIKNSNDDCDFFAFCDHDDIWDSDKLFRAISQLNVADSSLPCCYFCNFRLCDENGNVIGNSAIPKNTNFSYKKCLLCNPAPGCCMVFNKKARNLIYNAEIPKSLIMHDCWIMLICSMLGTVIYDNNSYISYRQHANNAIGFSTSIKKKIIFKLKYFFKDTNKYSHAEQAKNFKKIYGAMVKDEERLKILNYLCTYDSSLINRFKLVLDTNFTSFNLKTLIYFKTALLFGRW